MQLEKLLDEDGRRLLLAFAFKAYIDTPKNDTSFFPELDVHVGFTIDLSAVCIALMGSLGNNISSIFSMFVM
jgi:hypothetical protein